MGRSILPPALLILLIMGFSNPDCRASDPAGNTRPFGKMPLLFIKNLGQVQSDAEYYVQGRDKSLYFNAWGWTLVQDDENGTCTLEFDFLGADPDVKVEGMNRMETVFGIFKGRPELWKRNIPTFAKLVYPRLWPGIDLVFTGDRDRLKYAFIVRPGADPGRIRLAVRGATKVALTETGGLRMDTPAGSIEDGTPLAYQIIEDRKHEVPARFALEPPGKEGTSVYRFEAGPYDTGATLILDPALFVYSGFIGLGKYDAGTGIAVDDRGRAYVTGWTWDTTSPGLYDAFVARVNANGLGLDYCILLGGDEQDRGKSIAVDEKYRAYVTGFTDSFEDSFPVVIGPDLTYNGTKDAFVARVNQDGSGLEYCGYIGGSSSEHGHGIAVDGESRASVAGFTESDESSFPVVAGPDLTFNGHCDAFIARIKADGSGFEYCGYVGGAHYDYGHAISVDPAGNAFITGETGSDESSFPVHHGPDLSFNGAFDAFVAKLEADGTGFAYCGYIGGANDDRGLGIVVDIEGNALVTGDTGSDELSFPVAVGPDLTHNGTQDAFLARIRADGSGLDHCGYIGGVLEDFGRDIGVDPCGNVLVAGYTLSSEATFPVAVGPDITHNGGVDAFLARVAPGGSTVDYCGYIGGINEDYGYGMSVDRLGNAYVTGQTESDENSFPVITGPEPAFKGFAAVFVTKVYSPLSSETIVVDDSNISGPWNGTWKDPYQYIQEGIDRALNGDSVLVMPGSYRENIDFKGKSITVQSLSRSYATIIDGRQAGSSVIFQTGEFSESILDGFTILNGTGTYDAGLGSHQGGGIYCRYASPGISNNVIIENTVDGSGGGICCDCSFPVISNNILHGNLAGDKGGGIFCSKSYSMIVNNSLTGNHAGVGGGIACAFASSPEIFNTILYDNQAPAGPEIGLVNQIKPSSLFIGHSDLKGGYANAFIENGCTLYWGEGMIDSDPLYVKADIGDLHLTFNSPCRGSGDNSAVIEIIDFEGDSRTYQGTVDMGADEFCPHLYWTGDAVPGGSVEVKFVGLPGTSPVGLCIGTGVLDPPIPSMWGDWYLQFPIIGPIDLGKIPSPDGVLIIPGMIPGSPPPPYSLPLQALIGAELTNLAILEVQ